MPLIPVPLKGGPEAREAILRLTDRICPHDGKSAATNCLVCKKAEVGAVVRERKMEKRFRAVEERVGIVEESLESLVHDLDVAFTPSRQEPKA